MRAASATPPGQVRAGATDESAREVRPPVGPSCARGGPDRRVPNGQESGKGSVKTKRLRATLNDDHIERVLGMYDAIVLTRTVSRNHQQWSS